MLDQAGRSFYGIDMGISTLLFTVIAGVCGAVILEHADLLRDDFQISVQKFLPNLFNGCTQALQDSSSSENSSTISFTSSPDVSSSAVHFGLCLCPLRSASPL